MRMVSNVVLFQCAWFACVLGAAAGLAWPGPAVAAVACAVHVAGTQRRAAALALIAATTLLGLAAETTLIAAGLVTYAAPWPSAAIAPVWLLAMWAAFATLPDVALAPLKGRPLVAAALGALAGPLAYLGGARAGAMELASPVHWPLLAIAAMWLVAMPLIMALAVWLEPRRLEANR